MAGHSHWAGIKHKKGRADKERSKILAKNHNFGIAEALVKQFSRPTRASEFSFNKQQKE